MTLVARDSMAGPMPLSGRKRLFGGVIVAVLLSLPVGYLLSYAAFLVALLGLFYCILFGLLLGGVLYRFWGPLRPLPPRAIRRGVATVVLATWGGSLVWEGATFPKDVGKKALGQVVKIADKTGRQVRAEAEKAAKAFLAERYPPGGVIGYCRWAMSEQTMTIPILGTTHPKPIRYSGTGWVFMVRVALSALALALAIYSQVASLSKPAPNEKHESEPATTGALGHGDLFRTDRGGGDY